MLSARRARTAALIFTAMCLEATAQNVPLDDRFTYQGELRANDVVIDGVVDLRFSVFDQPAAGNQIGTSHTASSVTVSRGVFQVDLPVEQFTFFGSKRHLQIEVRSPAGSGAYTTLSPRVELIPTPNAHFARVAAQAFTAGAVQSVPLSGLVQKAEAAAITMNMLATGAVNSGAIADGTIVDADLAAGTITGAKIASNTINSSRIQDGAVTTVDLADSSVTSLKIQDGSITAPDLAPGLLNGGDADTVGGLQAGQFLRADASDSIAGGAIWNVTGGVPNSLTFGGTNLELNLGDSAADVTNLIGSVNFPSGKLSTVEGAVLQVKDADANLQNNTFAIEPTTGVLEIRLGKGSADNVVVTGQLEIQDNILTLQGTSGKRIRFEDDDGTLEANFSYEAIPNAFDVATHFRIGGAGTLGVGVPVGGAAPPNSYNQFGSIPSTSNADISTPTDVYIADDLEVAGDAFLGAQEGNSSIYFYDSGTHDGTWLRWDDLTGLTGCTTLPSITSAFVWNIDNNTSTGWILQNSATDNEFVFHANGNMEIDGALALSGSCDLAEAFFGEDLEPGTVVRIDPAQPESVLPTASAGDALVAGVVSTRPGMLLRGPAADAYALFAEWDATQAAAAQNPDDAVLRRRADNLERAIDALPRGNVAVALAGRVPVKVIGEVKPGDALTSSDVPGHAMAMRQPGVSIGVALESKAGEGAGRVLMLVQRGYHAPFGAEAGAAAIRQEAGSDAFTQLEQRLDRLEQRIDRRADRDDESAGGERRVGRDGNGRDGRDGRDSQRGRDDADVATMATMAMPRIGKEAWGDIDHDGRDDVLMLIPAGPSRLYRNLGDGLFQDVTSTTGLDNLRGLRLALLEDCDGDQHLDLLLVDDTGRATLHQGRGDGSFVAVTHGSGSDFREPIVEAEWLDHDHDGRKDLRVGLADGSVLLHHNLGGGAFRAMQLRPATQGADGAVRIAALEAELATLKAMLQALLDERSAR